MTKKQILYLFLFGLLMYWWISFYASTFLILLLGPVSAVSILLTQAGHPEVPAVAIVIGVMDLAVLSALPNGWLKTTDDWLRNRNKKAWLKNHKGGG